MSPPSATTRPRTICYVAATETAASAGAEALERVESGPDRSVRPATTVERVRDRAPAVDCVVFAETPTTAAGSTLLEVVDACETTPLILFPDGSYAPTAARATDGIDGYVRRDTDDAVVHLADEIEWVCGDRRETAAQSDSEADAIATSGRRATAGRQLAGRLLESVPDLVACRDRDRFFERLVESAVDALECECCWLSTVRFGDLVPRTTAPAVPEDALEPVSRSGPLGDALRTGEPLRIDDFTDDDRLPVPFEGIESVCCVPVGDVGIVHAAAPDSAAFDERDCDALATWGRIAAAVLERLDDDASGHTKRERLRRDRDRLEAERDRYRTLFANVPDPAIRYEIDDGRPVVRTVNDAFGEVFGTDPEAVVGDPVDESTVPPGLERRRATLLESLRAGERRRLTCRRETVDGVREFLLTLVPLETDTGGAPASGADGRDHNPEGLIVYSDGTEAARRERELAAAESRLETIAALVDDEIRAPLNVARGYLEIAEETGDREHFEAVDDAQERLRELVEQLVSIARRDEVAVETEPVAVHDVARRAWVAVETGDARLVTRAADDRVLEANKAQLRELFERLLSAVVDGPDEGDGTEAATGGSASDEPPVVTVSATDDGFAVVRRDSAASDRDLEADAVSGRMAAADGTGFGLGTVERIADAHGWSVGVVEDDDRIAFAFRGVEPSDVAGD